MIDKERLKEVLNTYIENINNIIRNRNDFDKYWHESARKKDFIIPYKTPIWKKSKNLQSFLSNRKMLDSRTKSEFNLENKIPYVLRFNHISKRNPEYFDNINEIVNLHSTISMGCHNIADRISVKNPKTIKSIRTFFSFPHYGKEKELKELTDGKLKYNDKRVVDENGKVWISHSINAIKNGNEFYKNFGEETIDELPMTDNKTYSETTFNQIGNDVIFDMDTRDNHLMGLYQSFNYIKRHEFDFGEFTDEELYEVERWLDYEWMGLISRQERAFFQLHSSDVKDGVITMNNYYISLLKEIGEEKGYKFIFPLLMLNIQGTKQRMINDLGSYSKANIAIKEVIEMVTESMAEKQFSNYVDLVSQKYDDKESEWEKLEEQLEDSENGFFLPLPTGFSTGSDYRKNYFESWIDGTKNRLSNYRD